MPLAIPMKNEIMKNSSGKNAEIAASAETPITRPMKMLFTVADSDCRMLLSISGIKNNPIVCQIGRESSIRARIGGRALPLACDTPYKSDICVATSSVSAATRTPSRRTSKPARSTRSRQRSAAP